MKKLILAVLTAVGIALGSVAASTPASASAVPVVYSGDWSHPVVKPQWLGLGMGGSVAAHTWHWNTWGQKTATSTGTLWVNNCVPHCAAGHYSYHKVYVTLYWIKVHNGQRYFYGMKWYTPGYKMTNEQGHLSSTTYWHSNNGYWG